jgi:hypothetical protein
MPFLELRLTAHVHVYVALAQQFGGFFGTNGFDLCHGVLRFDDGRWSITTDCH